MCSKEPVDLNPFQKATEQIMNHDFCFILFGSKVEVIFLLYLLLVTFVYTGTCKYRVSKTVVQLLSHVQLFATPWTAAYQASLFFTISPRICSNSCPLSWWCYPTISSSVARFSSCPQSLPTSGSFPKSSLLTSHGQSIGVSALASVLPMNIQDWFLLGWTGWISLQSKGLSRVFSVQFSLVVQSCLTLCNSMDCSMPGLPVHHQLLELTQTHVHWVHNAI